MTLNDRDKKILAFIESCPTNSFIVRDMFFPSLQTAQRRLNKLHEAGLVKRTRSYFGDNFIYYLDKKPRQVEHTLYLSKLLAYWSILECEIMTFRREIMLGKLRPDGIAVIRTPRNEVKTYLIEVECSHNSMSKKVSAYEEFYLDEVQNFLGCKPIILFITNKKIPDTHLEWESLRLDHI